MRAVVFVVFAFSIVTPIIAQQVTITDPPEVRGPFTLTATYDSAAGHNAFAFNGSSVPPLIRVLPGGVIKLHYVNHLPVQSDEMCAVGGCTNMSNLHFHGLHVSPERPQDDVLTMMAMPGEAFSASVREEILRRVEVTCSACGAANEQKQERIFTLNGEIRPRIPIDSGERQFWRIVNASPDLYADLQVSGGQFEIVALDGMPLSYHDPHRSTPRVDHVLVPPGGRVEAIVVGPPSNSQATLSSRSVDTGPDGDANPAMVIADVGPPGDHSAVRSVLDSSGPPAHDRITKTLLHELEADKPDFTVTFTEDKNGFYLNGKKFSMQDQPLVRVRVGGMQHWCIVNSTREVHPFHIHQTTSWHTPRTEPHRTHPNGWIP